MLHHATFLKFFSLLFLLAFAQPTLHAQSDWNMGYVVTNAGDTLHGYVRDRKTDAFGGLLDKVELKQKRRKKRFKPAKIQAYGWGGRRFVTLRTVTNSKFLTSETVVQEEGGEAEFYEVIVEGPLSLYHLEFSEQGEALIDFIPYFKREGNPRLVRATQGIFGLKKKLLAGFFADKPELVAKIENGAVKTPQEVVEVFQGD